jgi:hypothetical protein
MIDELDSMAARLDELEAKVARLLRRATKRDPAHGSDEGAGETDPWFPMATAPKDGAEVRLQRDDGRDDGKPWRWDSTRLKWISAQSVRGDAAFAGWLPIEPKPTESPVAQSGPPLDCLSVAAVARVLDTSEGAVRIRILKDRLPSTTWGRMRLIPKFDLRMHLDAQAAELALEIAKIEAARTRLEAEPTIGQSAPEGGAH